MQWEQFLSDNNIEYVTRGPNTKRGEVSIQCPWCGENDPSQHLGISLSGDNWGCHRDATHRGHSSVRLVAALLGCSYPQAKLIAGQYSVTDPSTLSDALTLLNATSEAPKPIAGPVFMPPDFRPIKASGLTFKFYRYLQDRGFDYVERLVSIYNLRCCMTGQWKDRIIIPLTDRKDKLVAWTARALVSRPQAPRYLSTTDIVKKMVFNEFELLGGGELLFIVEGPFDALKIDYYGMLSGARATCVFGTSITIDQIAALNDLTKVFDKVVILLDPEAFAQSFDMNDWLNAEIGELPKGVEDPGALTKEQVLDLVRKYL